MVPRLAFSVLLLIASQGQLRAQETLSGELARVGEIEVTVVEAIVGEVELRGPRRKTLVSGEPVLQFKIRIRNLSRNQTLVYNTWTPKAEAVLSEFDAKVIDDLGNISSPVTFGDAVLFGQIDGKEIAPGGYAEDVLVFEPPRPQAKTLTLALPGRAVGGSARFRIQVPVAKIKNEGLIEKRVSEPTNSAPPSIRVPPAPTSDPAPATAEGEVQEVAQEKAESASPLSNLSTVVIALLFVLGIVAYFVPTIVAYMRSHHHAASILVINLFLGWTFIAWVISLAMAVGEVHKTSRARRASPPWPPRRHQ